MLSGGMQRLSKTPVQPDSPLYSTVKSVINRHSLNRNTLTCVSAAVPSTCPPVQSSKETPMEVQSSEQLTSRKCEPCEGGVDPCPLPFVTEQLENLEGWYLTHENQRIRKDWTVKNFVAGLEFIIRVGEVAEADGHHPDVHLVGYKNLSIELWTHAIGGLSENDFILAAKIDQLPIELAS